MGLNPLHVCWFFMHGSPISCVVSFPRLGLGPARAQVGSGFALLGWFRRFRPPPPPLVLVRVRRPPLFFSLALSGFASSGPGVVVCVLSFLSFFAFPSRVLVKKFSFHFHLHLTLISFFSLTFTSSVGALVVPRP